MGVEKKYGDTIDLEPAGKVDSRPMTEIMMEEIDAKRLKTIEDFSDVRPKTAV